VVLKKKKNRVLLILFNTCNLHFTELQIQEGNDTDCSDLDTDSEEENNFDEKTVIQYYFNCGYDYTDILMFLSKYHGHQISYATLLRRLKEYGLKRRGFEKNVDVNTILEKVREKIETILKGPGSSWGYRMVWHSLEMDGVRVPRAIVQQMLKEIDPGGSEIRKAHRLKRRKYHNPGPNYVWHIDGYDKLKIFGFPIHGAIDGFSRKILWLNVTRSNNSPDNIAFFYLQTVEELQGCPVQLVTDLGTENGLAASIQSYFHNNVDAHRYVASPRNQRIEGWWSYYSKSRTLWWRNHFNDLEPQGILDTSSELSMECLWYCYSEIIQKDLDFVKNHWNTHYIRKSRHGTVAGRPDSLFYLPERHNAKTNLLCSVSQRDILYVSHNIVENNEMNEYQQYFQYVVEALGASSPCNCEEALQLYFVLMEISENGY